MSRYLPVLLTASIALGFSACETTKQETETESRYGNSTTTSSSSTTTTSANRPSSDGMPTPTPRPKRTDVESNPPTTTVQENTTSVEPAATPMPTPVVQDYPTAKAVEGKPGFVNSPFGGSGIVDVRGYPPGTEVKDPYTGKVFLVP
ncbi:MAG TPA: hypothetical protein VF585_11945 [Chthoniobacterales bacterium]|jgi:hypothetical protein